ncbi:MAG: DUF4215 domain-containing protein [Deltaproteobacteria bacterium]|nr:DUF4215 domain-containing protein [Deltaproteobacteria bacterium]
MRARLAPCCLVFALASVWSARTEAAPPGPHVVTAHGVLIGNAAPAVDGKYAFTVRLYAAADAKSAVFKESFVGVPVVGGQFTLGIGGDPAAPLTAGLLANYANLWLGVQVESEPELARVQVAWVPYAMVADTANSLSCTGCVGLGQLAAEVSNVFVKQTQLADVAKSGNFDDLLTKPPMVKVGTTCLAGEFAVGSAPNGSLLCAPVDLSNVATVTGANTFTKPQMLQGGAGLGKVPAKGCALDLSSALGGLCVDGAPATVVRTAGSLAEMDKWAKDSQIVYRSDNGEAYLYRKGAWRQFAFAPMCGDGLVDPGEECDDANKVDTDACQNDCKKPLVVNIALATCNAAGQSGPTQAQCNAAYTGGPLAGKITVSGGIQAWTVPADGTYRIEASGAQGALNAATAAGGKGARVRGDFALKVGQVLKFLVGQQGAKSPSATSSGGGGGTFVVLSDTTLLLAAGGGGGLGGPAAGQIGVNGAIASDGTKDSYGFGTGGTAGGGGSTGGTASPVGGGGGGGYTGDGKPKQLTSGYPGKGHALGGAGGLSRLGYPSGGFGGGGGNSEASAGGGGGGGYSGGAGGTYTNALYGGGGGGGSYNIGQNAVGATGVQSGNGAVTVIKL